MIGEGGRASYVRKVQVVALLASIDPFVPISSLLKVQHIQKWCGAGESRKWKDECQHVAVCGRVASGQTEMWCSRGMQRRGVNLGTHVGRYSALS